MDNASSKSTAVLWQKLGLSILCAVLFAVLVLMVFATAFVHDLVDKISVDNGGDHIEGTLSSSEIDDIMKDETVSSDYTGETMHPTDATIETLPLQMIDNPDVINIMLVGQDRRPGESRQRSDSMILCSLNKKTHAFTMISFLRDTYVTIPDHPAQKMNAAYALGGMSLLTETLATNFGVHLDGCIEVDFGGFTKIIDMLGGVDINLTQKEADWLNKTEGHNLSAGLNHFDGALALSYSRIRKLDMDAMRAQRQRKVITSLINAYKGNTVFSMITLAGDILDTGHIKTNMSKSQILSYVSSLFPLLSDSKITSKQIPISGTYEEVGVLGNIRDVKVIKDMDANRKLLQELLG